MQIGVDSQRAVENRRIFIVVEDEIIRAAMQFMLHDEYEAHEFAACDAALRKAAAAPPDLVILDAQSLAADGIGIIPLPLRVENVRAAVADVLASTTATASLAAF